MRVVDQGDHRRLNKLIDGIGEGNGDGTEG
jgi:hypothetical protein